MAGCEEADTRCVGVVVTYEDLVAYCRRAADVQSADRTLTLLDIVGLLQITQSANRAINAEVIARFMAEFIEYDRPKKQVH